MRRKLKPGDWVEVRSREEILRTLDRDGYFEGMQFMPEMLQYCGQRFQVYKRAHKSCDYTTTYPYLTRRIKSAVLLMSNRCDGSAHDGCEAGCTILWKEAWLKPIDAKLAKLVSIAPAVPSEQSVCTESALHAATRVIDPADGRPRFLCQATQIQKASAPMAWWDVRQYVEDYTSGNITLGRFVSGSIYSAYYNLSQAGIGVGPLMRWFYNKFRWVWRGSKWPRTPGMIPEGEPTPKGVLNLQPGELVRVKPHEEILRTVDVANRNRGMYWDAELVPYCGKTYRVLRRVNKLIIEQTGKMMEMKNPCIVLDSVICQARYSACRMFCPRAMFPYWREIWLERVNEAISPVPTQEMSESSAETVSAQH